MAEAELSWEVRGQAAWLSINREAQRNALSPEVIALFMEALDRAEARDDIRVMCITGQGQKAFCSGADLKTGVSGGTGADAMRNYARLLERLSRYPKPLVARVNGHCLAGGLGLLLSADIAYAREGVLFGTPEVKVGLFPMMVTALLLQNAVRKKAVEMLLTGRMFSAREAEAMGLITRAYPEGELDAAVDETLACIASQAPVALRMGRQAMAAVQGMPLEQALELLCDRLGDLIKTEDAAEGLAAFIQKRDPVWKGR